MSAQGFELPFFGGTVAAGVVQHGDERWVEHLRWLLIAVAVPLFVFLGNPLLPLSLAALAALAVLNLARALLRHSGMRSPLLAHTLFAAGVAISLLGLWPFLVEGAYPIQVLALCLVLDAVVRLRATAPPVAALGIGVTTLALVAFELLGLRWHERPGSVLLWCMLFVAVGVWAMWTIRPARQREPLSSESMVPPYTTTPLLAPPPPPARDLTRQQRVVLVYLAQGLTRREIADRMHLSVETVRSHAQGAYRALDARGRDEALARARERDILDIPLGDMSTD